MTVLEFAYAAPAPARDGAPLLVLLHGRGADERDLLGLRPLLPPELGLVLPRAPFPAAPWGYGPGRAWYRYLGGARPEPESFTTSLAELDAFLAGLPGRLGLEPGPIALGGFSQGGTLGIAFALARPGRIPAVLNFSGFLAEHPEVQVTPETVRGTRFFWGHGTEDPAIPFALAERGRSALRAAGADLQTTDHAIGHWIDADEFRAALDWLARTRGEAWAAGEAGAP